MKLLKADCIIDFYVSRKKYNSYKKEYTKKRYVENILFDYLNSLVGTIENGTQIRYCRITSNNFWGNEICFINDLNYSFSNQVEPRTDDKLPIRMFCVDMIGINILACEKFADIVKDNFIIKFSSVLSI